MTKKLKLNKESLVVLNEKEMAHINGGLNFLSLWGSNCYATDPVRHNCCAPDTPGDPTCDDHQWSMEPPCDPIPAYGQVRIAHDGTMEYLDDGGAVITDPNFDAVTAPHYVVE
jgi:natural product precursor